MHPLMYSKVQLLLRRYRSPGSLCSKSISEGSELSRVLQLYTGASDNLLCDLPHHIDVIVNGQEHTSCSHKSSHITHGLREEFEGARTLFGTFLLLLRLWRRCGGGCSSRLSVNGLLRNVDLVLININHLATSTCERRIADAEAEMVENADLLACGTGRIEVQP